MMGLVVHCSNLKWSASFERDFEDVEQFSIGHGVVGWQDDLLSSLAWSKIGEGHVDDR